MHLIIDCNRRLVRSATLERSPACCAPIAALVALIFIAVLPASSAVVSGTVSDPSWKGIPETQIVISSSALKQPIGITSNDTGTFQTPDLTPGDYEFRFSHVGFQDLIRTVAVNDAVIQINVDLKLAVKTQSVTISGAPSKYLNSEPLYRSLRLIGLGRSFAVGESSHLSLRWIVMNCADVLVPRFGGRLYPNCFPVYQ
ncbi:MAG TPA: carboxypeptidase-like regulatory domain-containing protein [Bryobacteraceae bacterium]|nr:carboxypeptidase-like regulatory domain-containing protein [Bryobacteraceae bacterium]